MRALLLCLLLAACGGGGGSSPSVPSAGAIVPTDSARYFGPLLGTKNHGTLTTPAGVAVGEWFAEPGKIRWGESSERWTVQTCNGKRYAWITGYGNETLGHFYAVESVRDLVDGVDLTSCAPGAAYTLGDFTPGTVSTTEQWFWTHHQTGERAAMAYWKGVFTFGGSRVNPCTGESRPVIVMREVWWDAAGGWVRGHPTVAGALPWRDGAPVPVEVNLDAETTFALERGVWTLTDGAVSACQRSLSAW